MSYVNNYTSGFGQDFMNDKNLVSENASLEQLMKDVEVTVEDIERGTLFQDPLSGKVDFGFRLEDGSFKKICNVSLRANQAFILNEKVTNKYELKLSFRKSTLPNGDFFYYLNCEKLRFDTGMKIASALFGSFGRPGVDPATTATTATTTGRRNRRS